MLFQRNMVLTISKFFPYSYAQITAGNGKDKILGLKVSFVDFPKWDVKLEKQCQYLKNCGTLVSFKV